MKKGRKGMVSFFIISIMLMTVFGTATSTDRISGNDTQVLHTTERVDKNGIRSEWNPSLSSSIRQPAEFEPMEGVLIKFHNRIGQFGIPYDLIAEMSEDVEVVTIVLNSFQENYVITQYQAHGVNLDNCYFLHAPSFYHWTRDFGPWFIFNEDDELGVVNFKYYGAVHTLWNFIDSHIPVAYANDQDLPLYHMPLHHEGGNYMTDGQGIAVSTDLVWSVNPFRSHSEINVIVNDYLGIGMYHVVPPADGSKGIGHIDCWAKYLSPDTIMILEVPQSHSQYDEMEDAVSYFENLTSCYGTPYEVVRVYSGNGEPYANSLILNDKVLVPMMGTEWDDDAIASYESAMPGYEVLGFEGEWYSSDALHCRTKEIPDRHMLYIEHTPLLDQPYNVEGFEVQGKIIPYSGESLIADSTVVYWKVEGESWNSIQMQPIGDNYYSAIIPTQETGTKICYYIHAEDHSGRTENHPYIGAPWAHSFTVSN